MPETLPEDPVLTRRFLDGEPSAIAAVDGWIRASAGSFRRRLSSEWDDLLQDLRLEIIRLLQDDRFRGESSLKTYVWRVVAHSCLDRVRSKSRRSGREVDLDGREGDLAPVPPRQAAAATRDLLERVLAETSEECRRLWRMIVDGASYREMAALLDVSEGALRVRVLRCRRKADAIRERLLREGNAGADRDARDNGRT